MLRIVWKPIDHLLQAKCFLLMCMYTTGHVQVGKGRQQIICMLLQLSVMAESQNDADAEHGVCALENSSYRGVLSLEVG